MASLASIRANFSYVDDIGRAHAGYHGWLDWSRWSTEAFAILELFRNREKAGLWNVAAASLTGLAPYFWGIISLACLLIMCTTYQD